MRYNTVAVFDLDGTLTHHDTYLPYLLGFLIRHPWRIYRLILLPCYIFLFALGKLNNTRLKQHFLRSFLGGIHKDQINMWTKVFLDKLVADGMNREGIATLEKHRQNGDYLLLLSASLDIYVKELGNRLGFDKVICTRTEWYKGRLTGKLSGENCKGKEKISRLLSLIKKFEKVIIIAYADHHSDIPLLSLADKGILVNGSHKAIKLAIREGIEYKSW